MHPFRSFSARFPESSTRFVVVLCSPEQMHSVTVQCALFLRYLHYTKNAQKYLESTPIIRGINGTELVELILKYYDKLSKMYRKMIPLKMVFIPVAKEDAK